MIDFFKVGWFVVAVVVIVATYFDCGVQLIVLDVLGGSPASLSLQALHHAFVVKAFVDYVRSEAGLAKVPEAVVHRGIGCEHLGCMKKNHRERARQSHTSNRDRARGGKKAKCSTQ